MTSRAFSERCRQVSWAGQLGVPPSASDDAQDVFVDGSDGARARADAVAGVLQDDIVGVDNACRHGRAGQPTQDSLSGRVDDSMSGCWRHRAEL